MDIYQNIDSIREKVRIADGILILTGAGMGVDGGIPDFRGKDGTWTSDKTTFMKFASGPAWVEHPLDTWNFYISRFLNYQNREPHAGYYELLQLVQDLGKDFYVITSNVDGHHKKSGYPAERVYEIHGNLEHIQCSDACHEDVYPMPEFTKLLDTLDEAPHCPRCGSVMRPNVLMFNDYGFVWRQVARQQRDYYLWSMTRPNLVGIEIGAGTAVSSIRDFGINKTSFLVRINPQEHQISRWQDISIPENAVQGIRTLRDLLISKS